MKSFSYLIVDEDIGCSLEDVLVFFSGSDRIPPMGFDRHPTPHFLHEAKEVLPTASTCDIQLRIPTCHTEYDQFREYMVLGMKSNDGFGGP